LTPDVVYVVLDPGHTVVLPLGAVKAGCNTLSVTVLVVTVAVVQPDFVADMIQ